MSGRKSQAKGAGGERELVSLLRAAGYPVERGGSQTFGAVPDVTGLPGIHVEVKRAEKLNLSDAMAQSIRDAQRFGDGMPSVFHRKNRDGWKVTMRLGDWLSLYAKSSAAGNEPQHTHKETPSVEESQSTADEA